MSLGERLKGVVNTELNLEPGDQEQRILTFYLVGVFILKYVKVLLIQKTLLFIKKNLTVSNQMLLSV